MHFWIVFSPQLFNMASNINKQLFLLTRSIFVCLILFGGCNCDFLIKKMGVQISLRSLRSLIPLRWEKIAVKQIWLFELLSWSLKMHAFSMNYSQSWANSSDFEASALCFEVILKRLFNSYGNVLLKKMP